MTGPPTSLLCLLVYLNTWCISVLQGSSDYLQFCKLPLQTERVPHSSLRPQHLAGCMARLSALSLYPTIWLTGSLWLPGTMQRTEMSLWGSSSLDHSSWGCATSWILRGLQWSSSETRWSHPDGPPCQPDFLCWGEGVFNVRRHEKDGRKQRKGGFRTAQVSLSLFFPKREDIRTYLPFSMYVLKIWKDRHYVSLGDTQHLNSCKIIGNSHFFLYIFLYCLFYNKHVLML